MEKPSRKGVVSLAKELLLGNEAIAWGAVLAGVDVASGYPGTPSSEVLSTLAELAPEFGFYAEWSVNEKVALEVAAGAAYTGARSIVTMKQVGLNVAADPLMTLAYIGIKGGMVIVSADDPGPHSSQNEQDTRAFARMAKLPVLEPGDPAEALELTIRAFEISEKLGVPVLLRPTTRVCHGSGPVELDRAAAKQGYAQKAGHRFERNSSWIIFPALARRRHEWLIGQQDEMRRTFSGRPFAWASGIQGGRAPLGVASAGISRLYVREALDRLGRVDVPVLEIAAFPPDRGVLQSFLTACCEITVVEEGDPILEEELIRTAWEARLNTAIHGRRDGRIPHAGELDVPKVQEALGGAVQAQAASEPAPRLPVRPPVLCPGCPHRASFYVWNQVARKKDAIFTGDIGCYTLGNAPPLDALDTCLCMGASFTLAQGLGHADPVRPHVAFLGDSTFFHTGIPGMINAVFNHARVVMVVLDNSTTAMTGNQVNPGVGRTVTGKASPSLDPVEIARACGVGFVREVDPHNLKEAMRVATEALQHDGPSVVVMRQPCPTMVRKPSGQHHVSVDPERCKGCKICLTRFGCPAMTLREGRPAITDNCTGCGVCVQVCPLGAIGEVHSNGTV